MREKIEDALRDFKLTVGAMKRKSPETTSAFVLRSVHKVPFRSVSISHCRVFRQSKAFINASFTSDHGTQPRALYLD